MSSDCTLWLSLTGVEPGQLPMTVLMWLFTVRMGVAVVVEVGLAALFNLAVAHGVDIIAGIGKEIPVMGDNHISQIQVAQDVDELMPGIWVQVVGRFVQQKGPGIHGEDGGK